MIFTGSTVSTATTPADSALRPCLHGRGLHRPYAAAANGSSLQTQNLAYSNDGGHLDQISRQSGFESHISDFRDPTFSGRGRQAWTMVVACPDDHKASFTVGRPEALVAAKRIRARGRHWRAVGVPELLEVPIDGRDTGTHPLGAESRLKPRRSCRRIGRAIFRRPVRERKFATTTCVITLWTDYGKDCYCALTFNHLPRTRRR